MPDEIKDKALYSQKYLQAKGLSPYAAAGIVGNLKEESNFSTTVKGKADNKGSEGIAQWHSERKTGLFNFAASQKRNWKGLDTQLDYIIYELNQPQYKKALQGLKKAKSAEEATMAFMNDFEKPAKWAIEQSKGRRVAAANEALSKVGVTTPEYTYEEEEVVKDEDTENFFPDYREISPEENSLLKAYVDESTALVGNIRTPQGNADIAKQRVLQKQNEIDFLSELGSIDMSMVQEAPQQNQEEEVDLYQAPELNLPEYEQPELPVAQDGFQFTKMPTANFQENKTSKTTEIAEIKKLQKDLISKGYDLGKYGADGIIGPKTKKAIEDYKLNNLKKDITIGTETKKIPYDVINREIPVNENNKYFFRLRNKIDKIDSTIDDIARGIIPAPKNVSSFLNFKSRDSNKMSTGSFNKVEKTLLYNLVENAIGRTGKTTGGIEYEDYSKVMPKEDYEQLYKVIEGNANPITGLLLGASSPGFNIGTTLGRFSYAKNNETGEIAIGDSYDFVNNYTQDSKTGKLKSDYMSEENKTAYQKERKSLAEKDQKINKEALEKRKIGVVISPKDIEDIELPTESSYVGKKIYEYDNQDGERKPFLRLKRKKIM